MQRAQVAGARPAGAANRLALTSRGPGTNELVALHRHHHRLHAEQMLHLRWIMLRREWQLLMNVMPASVPSSFHRLRLLTSILQLNSSTGVISSSHVTFTHSVCNHNHCCMMRSIHTRCTCRRLRWVRCWMLGHCKQRMLLSLQTISLHLQHLHFIARLIPGIVCHPTQPHRIQQDSRTLCNVVVMA